MVTVKEANVESGESGSQSTCHRMEQTNINKPFTEQSSSRISIATRVAHGPSVLTKNGINRSCEAILTDWSAIVIVANEITFFTSDIRLGAVSETVAKNRSQGNLIVAIVKSHVRGLHYQLLDAYWNPKTLPSWLSHPIWSMMNHGTGKWWHI